MCNINVPTGWETTIVGWLLALVRQLWLFLIVIWWSVTPSLEVLGPAYWVIYHRNRVSWWSWYKRFVRPAFRDFCLRLISIKIFSRFLAVHFFTPPWRLEISRYQHCPGRTLFLECSEPTKQFATSLEKIKTSLEIQDQLRKARTHTL